MINRAAKSLKNALRRLRIAPYHEASHRGEVRYVQLVIERPTNRVQVTVVGKTEGSDAAGHLSEALIDDLGDALHSVYWNTQPLRSNTIFGNETRRLHGEPYIQDHLPHATTFTPTDAFGQANPAAAEKMIEELRKFITHRAHVADLYCGVGPIGLSLLDIASKITFVEVAPGSLSGLRQGIAALPTSDHERVAVHEGAVDEHLDACHGAEVVIADPPRKGLDDKLVRALCRIVPKTVIVIHCGLAAFERDLTSLVVNGPFQIQHLSAHDFFPHSGHAEVMTVLVPSEAI